MKKESLAGLWKPIQIKSLLDHLEAGRRVMAVFRNGTTLHKQLITYRSKFATICHKNVTLAVDMAGSILRFKSIVSNEGGNLLVQFPEGVSDAFVGCEVIVTVTVIQSDRWIGYVRVTPEQVRRIKLLRPDTIIHTVRYDSRLVPFIQKSVADCLPDGTAYDELYIPRKTFDGLSKALS